jgi:hypothetical protein
MKICKDCLTCHYTTCQFAKPTNIEIASYSSCADLMIEYDQYIRDLRKQKLEKINGNLQSK